MPSKAHVGSNASKAPTSRRGGWRETQGFFGKCFDVFSGGDLRNMKAEDIKCSTWGVCVYKNCFKRRMQ